MKLPFKIKEVKPRIFLFEFTDQYAMCMNFLRYQEFYESPNPKFRNKSFKILDFMEWYSKDRGGIFTYPKDWTGFNFNSQSMLKCLGDIKDYNKYDDNMNYGYAKCIEKIDPRATIDQKFYIIGAMKGNTKTLQHEIAHGLFYLNKLYKKEMTKLVNDLPAKTRKSMEKMLKNTGYTQQVYIDEIQAYFSTENKEQLKLRGIKLKNEDVIFKELYNKFNE